MTPTPHADPMRRARSWRTPLAATIVAVGLLGTACAGSDASGADRPVESAPVDDDALLPDPDVSDDGAATSDRLAATTAGLLADLLALAEIGEPEALALLGRIEAELVEERMDEFPPSAPAAPLEIAGFATVGWSFGAPPVSPEGAGSAGVGVLYSLISQSLTAATSRPAPVERPEDVITLDNHVLVDGTDIDVRVLDSRSADGLTMDTLVAGTMAACPDPSGAVGATLTSEVAVTSGDPAGASAGVTYTITIDIDASVGDDARLADVQMTVDGSAAAHTRDVSGDRRETEGYFVEGGSTTTFTRNAVGGLQPTGVTGPGITRSSAAVDDALAQKFIDAQYEIARLLTDLVLAETETVWRSGACVEVELQPQGDVDALEAGDEIVVDILPTSADDETPVDGTATASATGAEVTPGEVDVPEPGAVTVTMGDGDTASLAVEVTSRRGIGRATLDLAGAHGWVANGALGPYQASGLLCGPLTGSWTIDIGASFEGNPFDGTIVVDLTAGTYALSGTTTGGGFSVSQQGSGSVAVIPSEDGTAVLEFTGTAFSGGPVETYGLVLVPATGQC